MKLLTIFFLIGILVVSGCVSQTEPATKYRNAGSEELTSSEIPKIPNVPTLTGEIEVSGKPEFETRVIERSVNKEELTVTLDVNAIDSRFYTLEEYAPSGWKINSVSSKNCNIIDENKINCAEFSQNDQPIGERKITYTFSKEESGSYYFRGTYTMEDTKLTMIQGEIELTV